MIAEPYYEHARDALQRECAIRGLHPVGHVSDDVAEMVTWLRMNDIARSGRM